MIAAKSTPLTSSIKFLVFSLILAKIAQIFAQFDKNFLDSIDSVCGIAASLSPAPHAYSYANIYSILA